MWSNAFKPAAKDRSTLVLAVAPAEAAKASIFLIALRLDRHLLLAVPLEASIFLIACLDRTASNKCRSRSNAIRKIDALAASAGATANTNVDLSFAAGLNALDHMVGDFRVDGQHRPCRYWLCRC